MWAIGIDLGGTKTEVAHVNENGTVERRVRFETISSRPPSEIQNDMIKAVNELKSQSDIPPVGVGVGIAGQVDKEGKVLFAPNLQWHNIPLQQYLLETINLPIFVTNDVRAATMAEWRFGAAANQILDFICIFLGTGIGSGLVSEGRLITGYNNAAGEIGHMTVELDGPVCSCGNRGCLESIAGGWGLVNQAKDAIKNDPMTKSSLKNIETITGKDVIEASVAGDPLAVKIVKRGEEALIAGVANLLNVINPQTVILGGGLANGWPNLFETLSAGVKLRALKATSDGITILPAKLGNDSGVIGAACQFF